MAGTERKPDAALIELLATEGSKFDFFQAVQMLHRLAPGSTPVGELGPIHSEPVRFVHDPQLIFHSTDITRIVPRKVRNNQAFAEVTSTFLGLFGAASPLANFISEDVLRAEAEEQSSLKAFYDLFHHRLLSLFYRAWKKYRFDAGFRVDGSDAFSRRALAFVGVDLTAGLPSHALPPLLQLSLAPLLSQKTRSARTLQIVLEELLPGVPIRIESFIARYVRIQDDQRVLLGVQNTRLNQDFTIGRRVLDRSGRFRVCLGPVSYQEFESLMPGGRQHATLRKVIEQFATGVLESELELQVEEKEAPRFQLASQRGSILGTTTQLSPKKRKPMRVRVVLSEDLQEVKPYVVRDDDNDDVPSAR